MTAKLNPPVGGIVVEEPETETTKATEPESTGFCPKRSAMAITKYNENVLGTIVCVMNADGTLKVGYAVRENDVAKEHLGKLAQAIKAHADSEWDNKPRTASGAFVDDDKQN